jgi:hypothetical protein
VSFSAAQTGRLRVQRCLVVSCGKPYGSCPRKATKQLTPYAYVLCPLNRGNLKECQGAGIAAGEVNKILKYFLSGDRKPETISLNTKTAWTETCNLGLTMTAFGSVIYELR